MGKETDILFCVMFAINSRKQANIKYDGEKVERLIEPYVLGENAKKEMLIRAFDVGKNDCRLFKIAKINAAENTVKDCVGIRAGYNSSGDKAIKKILKQVK